MKAVELRKASEFVTEVKNNDSAATSWIKKVAKRYADVKGNVYDKVTSDLCETGKFTDKTIRNAVDKTLALIIKAKDKAEKENAKLHEVESSKVNNEQEVKLQSNKSKNMATKKSKTVKVEDSKSVNNAVDNFDAPVMDERILKLNELKAVKMANLSKGKRPAAKEAKELATYILNNWDNEFELLNVLKLENIHEDLRAILASRLENFADAKKACEEAVKETKKAAPAKAPKADSKKAEPKAKEEVKKETKPAKTARKVGDVHPNHPTWVWTEYAEGKFDWRTNPADKKQGQRTDKATTSEKKSEPKKDTKKASNKKVAKGGKVETKKEEKPKELTIDEFVALPTKSARGNKKPSEAQKEALKLVMKGYRVTADHKFFENAEGDKKACNWESVVAMIRRYGMEYIPVGLVK